MRKLWSVMPGILFWLASTPLQAQTIPSPYRYIETRHTVGVYGGVLRTDKGDFGFGPESGPVFGARYDIHFTGPLSGELGLGFSPTERTIFTRAAPGSGQELIELGTTDARILLGEAGFKFSLTGARSWRGFAPFLGLGVGFMADLEGTDPREAAIPEEQRFQLGPSFAVSGGAGSDFFLTERLSLRAEVRDYLWRLVYPAELTPAGRRGTDWTNNLAITLGGAIHF